MATLGKRATAVIGTLGSTWASTANAVDGTYQGTTGTFATWTNATRNGAGYIDLGTFGFDEIPADATLNSVTVYLRHYESATGTPFDTTEALLYLYDGATVIGSPQAITLVTSATQHTFTGVTPTLTQVRSTGFEVRVEYGRLNTTTSGVAYVDYVDVLVDYTPAAVDDDGPAENAPATGTANDTTSEVAPGSEAATASAAALQPTVVAETATSVDAGLASSTGTGNGVTTTLDSTIGAAIGAGSGWPATGSVAGAVTTATGAGAGLDPTVERGATPTATTATSAAAGLGATGSVAAAATTGTGSGAGLGVTTTLAPVVDTATAAGAGLDATAQVVEGPGNTEANAQNAVGTALAYDVSGGDRYADAGWAEAMGVRVA